MVEKHTGFECVGTQIILGTGATVKRHVDIGAASWKRGVSAPTAGFSGNFPHLSFADGADEAGHYNIIVPFVRATGADMDIIVDWYYTGAQDNGKVLWKMTYLAAKAGEDPTAAGTTTGQLTAGTHTTGQLVSTTFLTGISTDNLEDHDTLGLMFWRDGDDETDTLGKAAIVLTVHIDYISDKLGEPI